jgi:putative membrane protein
MSERGFLLPAAREAVRQAIAEIERDTSAEVVVTLRRHSGDYRRADFLLGFLLALVTLLLLLFLPQAFALIAFPIDLTLAFLGGVWLGPRFPAVRRALTPAAARRASVHACSRAAFVDLGIHRLPRRNGLLVYVSLLERSVEVLPDTGLDPTELGRPWELAVSRLRGALLPRPAFEGFLAALRALGPALGRAYPRAADDVDELPNEVSVE